jgi:hypothetical protein
VIAALRQGGVGAPIFVAIETGYCDGPWTPPKPNNTITDAERRVIAALEGLYHGADMDAALNSPSDRCDRCHMSKAGARKPARLWTYAIAPSVPSGARLLLKRDDGLFAVGEGFRQKGFYLRGPQVARGPRVASSESIAQNSLFGGAGKDSRLPKRRHMGATATGHRNPSERTKIRLSSLDSCQGDVP